MVVELRQFILDTLQEMHYPTASVSDETPLGHGGLDLESLAIAELALRLEDVYQVKIADEETEQVALMTLGEFVAMAAQRAAATSVSPTT